MNILFWNDTLEVGGGETWAIGTAACLRERGHTVTFACPSGSWTQEQAQTSGFAHFDYFFEPAFNAHLMWEAERFFKEYSIDAVVCTVMGNRTESALLAGIIRRVGKGAVLLRVGASPWSGLSSAHLGYGMEDVVRGTLVNSDFLKCQILNRFPEISRGRVELLPNGVDTQILDPARHVQRGRMRRALGVPERFQLMGAVGRLTRVKNYPLLLRTSAKVFEIFPEAFLAIVGEGEDLEQLKALSRDLNISDRVRFFGYRKDIPEILSAIDLFVHPSAMEGSPNAVLEAMAMAKPVVATQVGGVPELVLHGQTGLLVPSGDEAALGQSLLRLLFDTHSGERMGDAGRLRIQQHFEKAMVVAKLETYLKRIGGGWRDEVIPPGFPTPAQTCLPPQPPRMFFPPRCHRRYPFRISRSASVLKSE